MPISSRFKSFATATHRAAHRAAIVLGLTFSATLALGQDKTPDGPDAEGTGDVARPSSSEIMNNPFLRNALSRSTEGLVFTRAPGGPISVDLQGRFQNVTVARIGADGEIEMTCSETHESLAAFMAAHPDASEDDFEGETIEDSEGVHRDE